MKTKRFRAVVYAEPAGTVCAVTTVGHFDDLDRAIEAAAARYVRGAAEAAVFDSKSPGGPVWEHR